MSRQCSHCNLMQSSTKPTQQPLPKMKYADLRKKLDKTIEEVRKYNENTTKLNADLQRQTTLLQKQRSLVLVESEKYALLEKQLNISKLKFKQEQILQTGQSLRSTEIETQIDNVEKHIKFRNESMVIESLMTRYQTEIKALNNVREIQVVKSSE